jgi:hypothetical protein
LIEDGQDDVDCNDGNRHGEGEFHLFVQHPRTKQQGCGIAEHGKGIEPIQAGTISIRLNTHERANPEYEEDDNRDQEKITG